VKALRAVVDHAVTILSELGWALVYGFGMGIGFIAAQSWTGK